jgi:gas vesicle protein
MRVLKKAVQGFLWGILAGGVMGALGGLFDRGSMVILAPSGPVFWSLFGAFIGAIVGPIAGILYAVFSKPST